MGAFCSGPVADFFDPAQAPRQGKAGAGGPCRYEYLKPNSMDADASFYGPDLIDLH